MTKFATRAAARVGTSVIAPVFSRQAKRILKRWPEMMSRSIRSPSVSRWTLRACELVEHGHSRFIDRIEADSSHSWRVHFFCLDEEAAVFIAKINGESCAPGSPVRFNPTEFVLARLNKLQRLGQLERRYPWWDDDFE